MGKLHTFEIRITNPGGICHPGDTLTGQVVLDVNQAVDTKEVRIECRGVARVFWVDRSGTASVEVSTPTHVDQFTAEEEYLSRCKSLCSGLLSKGSHCLRFDFFIPQGAPSSFDGEFGFIRYWLKVYIERSWRTDSIARNFTVLSKVDLNDLPHANETIESSDHMKVSTLFSQSGVCHAALRLDRRGFVPGEIIPFTYVIRNDTARDIHKVTVELRETTDYGSGSQVKRTERVVNKLKFGSIPARVTFEKRDNRLRLEACPPDNLRGCSLINTSHKVVLKVKPSAISFKKLRIPIELIVGTVPLRKGSLSSIVGPNRGIQGLRPIQSDQEQDSYSKWKALEPPKRKTLFKKPLRSTSPSSPDVIDKRASSIDHDDGFLTLPAMYSPPRPRANTNSSLLRARGR